MKYPAILSEIIVRRLIKNFRSWLNNKMKKTKKKETTLSLTSTHCTILHRYLSRLLTLYSVFSLHRCEGISKKLVSFCQQSWQPFSSASAYINNCALFRSYFLSFFLLFDRNSLEYKFLILETNIYTTANIEEEIRNSLFSLGVSSLLFTPTSTYIDIILS